MRKILLSIALVFSVCFLTACTVQETQVVGQLKVSYIDVGQGDSELIQSGSQTMLIDAGTNDSTNALLNYLSKAGVKKIDYLVLTHPHEDHIGGADAVINKYSVGQVYMPKVTATTKTFEDVVTAMKSKGLKATIPQPGASFKLGDASCTILGPINSEPGNLNTYSIVLKMTYGKDKFLFMGDAASSNEADMIARGYDLSANVLKLGHHGSSTSTSDAFLSQVSPRYAVISCGQGNDYGHPHLETMNKLKAKGITVYRTDESGTIVCTSDGTTLTFDAKPGDYKSGDGTAASAADSSTAGKATAAQNKSMIVYITKSGKCYHLAGCEGLARSKIAINLADAKEKGYKPCSICHPPQK